MFRTPSKGRLLGVEDSSNEGNAHHYGTGAGHRMRSRQFPRVVRT